MHGHADDKVMFEHTAEYLQQPGKQDRKHETTMIAPAKADHFFIARPDAEVWDHVEMWIRENV